MWYTRSWNVLRTKNKTKQNKTKNKQNKNKKTRLKTQLDVYHASKPRKNGGDGMQVRHNNTTFVK